MTESNPMCPICKNKKTALILWGYTCLDEELQKAINNKEIALGGCIVTDHDPKWECTSCNHRWGERDED